MELKIKEVREAKGMTQEELAARANVSRQTISALENGTERSVLSKTLCAIAEALDTTVDKIFTQPVKSM